MKNKSIFLITSEFPPLPGGIGNHAYLLSKQLQKSNYEVSVLCDFRSEQEDLELDKKQSFNIYRIKRNKFTPLNRLIKAFSLAKNNNTIICSGKFSLWTGGLLKVIFNSKNYIAILHGSEISAGGKISKMLTNWSINRFNKIIAVSNFTKKRALHINAKLKIVVINNGFIIPKSNNINDKKNIFGNPKIITIGNLTYRKGQLNVIKALPLLKNHFPQIHYHCIGIPTEKTAFSAIAIKLKVQDHITFHGALSNNELETILKDSDIFFMLSDVLNNGDFEGFGIAILEANSLGIPAIGSNNCGIVDAIKTGFSGELVDPKNKEVIVDALIKIMANYDEYSKNAIEWSTNFSWDKIGKKYIEIIEK